MHAGRKMYQGLDLAGQDVFADDALFALVLGRHGPALVEDIRDIARKSAKKEVQYLEMKQMWDIMSRYRSAMRKTVHLYRDWKNDYERERDELERTYKAYEGIHYRQQLQQAWSLYLTVNRDYHEMRRTYLASLRRTPHWSVVK